MYKKILTILLLTGIAFSQQKIGIVFSEKIRLDFEEFKDVEQQLQLELEVIQKEYQTMATELDSMVKEYEQQSLMMSEELKKAKEQDIVDMNNSMQSYQLSKVGPNGELTRKQAQLEFELVEKFKTAVNAVAISKPSFIDLGSIPLSNLYFASVLIFNSRAVFLMDAGKK